MKFKGNLLLVGSASVHVLNFHRLVSEAFDDTLILSNADVFEGLPVKLASFSLRNPIKYRQQIRHIRNIIQHYQPSIVHIHQANAIAWFTMKALEKSDIPVVLTAWGDDVLINPYKNRFFAYMAKYNLSRANVCTSDSLFMAAQMQKLIPESSKEIVVCNFGVDIPEKASSRQKVIFSNRLHKPMYRIKEIIRAFARFKQSAEGSDWQLWIAGQGSETDHLKALAKQLNLENATRFMGWLTYEENQRCYAQASLFVSIPVTDATSVSLLEALSHGCIPVVSNLPANMEWVIDGINGLIVQNVNDLDFNAALKIEPAEAAVLNRKIIRLKAGRDDAKARFFSIYHKLLKSRT